MIFTNSNMDPGCRFAKAINSAATTAASDVVLDCILESNGDLVRTAALLGVSMGLMYRLVEQLDLGADVDAARATVPIPAKRPRGRPVVPRYSARRILQK